MHKVTVFWYRTFFIFGMIVLGIGHASGDDKFGFSDESAPQSPTSARSRLQSEKGTDDSGDETLSPTDSKASFKRAEKSIRDGQRSLDAISVMLAEIEKQLNKGKNRVGGSDSSSSVKPLKTRAEDKYRAIAHAGSESSEGSGCEDEPDFTTAGMLFWSQGGDGAEVLSEEIEPLLLPKMSEEDQRHLRIAEVYGTACRESPLVAWLDEQLKNRFEKLCESLTYLWSDGVVKAKEDMGDKWNITDLPQQVKERLDLWKASLNVLEKKLETHKLASLFRSLNHQNMESIENALRLVTRNPNPMPETPVALGVIDNIVRGEHTPGYNFTSQPSVNRAGARDHPYASARLRALVMVLLATHATLGANDRIEDVLERSFGQNFLERDATFIEAISATSHFNFTPWLQDKENAFITRDGRLLLIHNGQTTENGGNSYPLFSRPFGWAPLTPAGFIGWSHGASHSFKLKHLVKAANAKNLTNGDFRDFGNDSGIKKLWQSFQKEESKALTSQTDRFRAVQETFDPYLPNIQLSFIKPGNIFVRWHYGPLTCSHERGYLDGMGGEGGIVLGFIGEGSNQQVVVLGSFSAGHHNVLEGEPDDPFPLGGVDGLVVRTFKPTTTVYEDTSRDVVYFLGSRLSEEERLERISKLFPSGLSQRSSPC